MKPSLIVHGGAWDIPDEAVDACKQGCHRALAAGWSVLAPGGSVLDAVEAAVVVLEDDPVFDAGYGSHLNAAGKSGMRRDRDEWSEFARWSRSGIAAIEKPDSPSPQDFRRVRRDMMLIAKGAERFAKSSGLKLCRPEELVSEAEWEAFLRCSKDEHAAIHHRGHEQGTVGAVAMDREGRLFAATSTGGTCCKLPGRVGDSPLIGCGCYADLEAGGISCTGYGEAIMKIVMAKSTADFLCRTPIEDETEVQFAKRAADDAVALLAARGKGTGGLILLDSNGTPAVAFNTPRMAHGYVTPDEPFFVSV